MRQATWIVLAGLALGAGCDTAEDRPAAWPFVYAGIVRPACATAGCHSALAVQASVDLSTSAAAYAVLTGSVCGGADVGSAGGNFVVPGHPEASQLMHMLRGDNVARMPPDVPLPDGEIALVERWILEGAPCE